MRFVKLRDVLACGLLLGAPATALAQPGPDDYGDHYDVSIAGEPVASVDVFYDQLAPYGVWVDDANLGRVFTPSSPDFVPYTRGHWQYTDVGFVWVSPEPFEWATAHYGRWAYSRDYGRWVWRPDTQWGPAWVEWRESGDDFGWAPLPPEVAIDVDYAPPMESWHYCAAAHVLDADVARYYEPRSRVIEIHRAARPLDHFASVGGARVVVGPSAATLRERHVEARPTKIEAHTVGRWTPTEAQAAQKHAQDHRVTVDEQNRKRLESDAALRKAQAKVKVTTPAPRRDEIKPPPVMPPKPKETRQPKQLPQLRQPPTPTPAPMPARPQPARPQPARPQPARPEPQRPQVKAEPRPQPAPQVKAEPRPQPAPQVQHAPPAPRPEPVQRAKPEPQRAEPRPQQPRPEPVKKADPRQPDK